MAAGSVNAPIIIPLKEVPNVSSRLAKCRRNDIKTDTPIELSNEMKDTTLYYTINGDKPDPFKKLGSGSTFKYAKPFVLPSGKKTVKALAVRNKDSCCSAIVTKVFTVERAPAPQPTVEEVSSCSSSDLTDDLSEVSSVVSSVQCNQQFPGTMQHLIDTQMQPLRQQERTMVKCLKCNTDVHYTADAHFCSVCGHLLPLLPDRKGLVDDTSKLHEQFLYCRLCKAVVPENLSLCPSCNTPVENMLKLTGIIAQYNLPIKDAIVCCYCGTCNSHDCHMCVTCERVLIEQHCRKNKGVPALIIGKDDSYVMCSSCGRINARDARFCDWCGAQPHGNAIAIECRACGRSNDWPAQHCSTCRAFIKPSIRLTLTDQLEQLYMCEDGGKGTWHPVVRAEVKVEPETEEEIPVIETKTQGTQTDGIFYKSALAIEHLQNKIREKESQREGTKRNQHLSKVSPGKGFWRQQMDHICGHLKAYAASSTDFQQAIGHQKMGKVDSVSLADDENEVTLSVKLQLVNHSESTTSLYKKDQPQAGGDHLRQSLSLSTADLRGSKFASVAQLVRTVHKAKSSFNKPTRLSVENYFLIEELSKEGKGRSDIVQQLVEKGGSVHVRDENGVPLVCLAARGGHSKALKVLLEFGADCNAVTNTKENTALHEAVLQGESNLSSVELLLSHRCDVHATNKAGLTASQIAQERGYKSIAQCLAVHIGKSKLKSLLK